MASAVSRNTFDLLWSELLKPFPSLALCTAKSTQKLRGPYYLARTVIGVSFLTPKAKASNVASFSLDSCYFKGTTSSRAGLKQWLVYFPKLLSHGHFPG